MIKSTKSALLARRSVLAGAGAMAALHSGRAWADTTGVTDTEIKIGNTTAYSGPASAYSAGAKALVGYWKMVNEQGGVNGRKINFLSLDDGYQPAKTVEVVRKLVEEDKVAFLSCPLGTACNSAIQRYMNQKKVPQLFVASGADKWADPEHFPWTIGWGPSYRTEGAIYAKYILTQRPNAKIAILYQNDDFGKDYIVGVKSILGNDYDKHVVSVVSYEVSDATVDSQVSSMQASGADCLITAATPKFGAQVIRRVYDIGWKALHCITNVSSSVGSVLKPVGLEKAVGIVTSTYLKDTNDPVWKNDAGMNIWREFAAKYTPELDITDNNNVVGYGYAATTHEVLKQCGRDMSRENIMRQAANLNKLDVKILLPGITINTSPTNFRPIRQMQLVRWTGEFWDRFGDMLEG